MSNEKSAIEKLREQIAVANADESDAKDVKDTSSSDDNEENSSEEDQDTTVESESEEASETPDADISDVEEDLEESEDKQKELEKQKSEAKNQKEKERIQRKIDREVAKRKVLEEEIASLKAQLEAKSAEDGGKLTQADAEKMAKEIANSAISEKEFTDTCNRIADEGEKLNGSDGKPLGKKFMDRVNEMASDIGAIPADMIYILGDLDNGANVLNHLADPENVDEAEKIYHMPTAKKAIALTKLSAKLSAPKPKPISKVPPPNQTLNSVAKGAKMLRDDMTDAEWIRARNEQILAKLSSRGY